MQEQMMKLKKIKDTGKLNEHLEAEPHFLSTTLCDDRMTTEQIQSVIIDMFTGAIDSVIKFTYYKRSLRRVNTDINISLHIVLYRVI